MQSMKKQQALHLYDSSLLHKGLIRLREKPSLRFASDTKKKKKQKAVFFQNIVWSDVLYLHFNCDIWMVGSEFGVNNMKAMIHCDLCQRFRLVEVV